VSYFSTADKAMPDTMPNAPGDLRKAVAMDLQKVCNERATFQRHRASLMMAKISSGSESSSRLISSSAKRSTRSLFAETMRSA
jgi:hypothetical protein